MKIRYRKNGSRDRMTMHKYPSDITRDQFELIREDLERGRRKTRPRKYDLYDIFCAVLYILKGGIQWRMLPPDFPKWQLVYYYFRIWSQASDGDDSVLEDVLKKIGNHGARLFLKKRQNFPWDRR